MKKKNCYQQYTHIIYIMCAQMLDISLYMQIVEKFIDNTSFLLKDN